MIKITSDGTGPGTHVYNEDGSEIMGIQDLNISISVGGLAKATLSFAGVKVEVKAEKVIPTFSNYRDYFNK